MPESVCMHQCRHKAEAERAPVRTAVRVSVSLHVMYNLVPGLLLEFSSLLCVIRRGDTPPPHPPTPSIATPNPPHPVDSCCSHRTDHDLDHTDHIYYNLLIDHLST